MKSNSIFYIIIVILAVALIFSFCKPMSGTMSATMGSITPSEAIVHSIKDNKAHGALLFNSSGQITLVNSKGEPGKPCSFAMLDPKLQAKSKYKPCKGFDDGKVLNFKAIPLISTKGSFCMGTIGPFGQPMQICD